MDSENIDEFMKELGVGWAMRMAAKSVKPRRVISENDGKWNIKSESTFKNVAYDFTPEVEFNETTPDGREVTVRMVLCWNYRCLSLFPFRQLFIFRVINGSMLVLIKMDKNL